MIYCKAKARPDNKPAPPPPPIRRNDWDHRSGREDTWRSEPPRPAPGPGGMS